MGWRGLLLLICGCAEEDRLPGPDTGAPTDPTAPEPVDDDGDGFASDVDCRDDDPTIFPGAPELCDQIDSDCGGDLDEGLITHHLADGGVVDLTDQASGGLAVSGGELGFCPGTYELGAGGLQVGGTTVLSGVGDAILSGSGSATVFAAAGSELTIQGLALTGTGASVLEVSGVELVLDKVSVVGAAVQQLLEITTTGRISIRDSRFVDNTVSAGGLLLAGERVEVFDTQLIDNAVAPGGLLVEVRATRPVYLQSLILEGNGGTGLTLSGLEQAILGDLVVRGQTSSAPAVVLLDVLDAQLFEPILEGNAGPGLRVEAAMTSTYAKLYDPTIADNAGSGAFIDGRNPMRYGASLVLEGGRISGNGTSGAVDGGGIMLDGYAAYAEADGVSFEANTGIRGGAIATVGGYCYIYDSSLYGNAASAGGALFVGEDSSGGSYCSLRDTDWGQGPTANQPYDVAVGPLLLVYDFQGLVPYVSCNDHSCS